MKIFFSKILLMQLILLLISSCSANKDSSGHVMNNKFKERYSGQVKNILKNKNIEKRYFKTTNTKKNRFNLNPNFKLYSKPSQILSNESPINKTASFETHRLFLKRPEASLPNSATYKIGKKNSSSSKIPHDIFDIKYNTANHPPFQITGIDFDIIVIPKKDAYGVPSSLNNKHYPITGSNYVSRNINSIIKNRDATDVGFTEKLIAEQKAIRKEIAIASLYESDVPKKTVNKDSYDYDNTKEKWAVKKRKVRNDPINQIIASQIVSRNLKSVQQAQQKENPNQNNNPAQ